MYVGCPDLVKVSVISLAPCHTAVRGRLHLAQIGLKRDKSASQNALKRIFKKIQDLSRFGDLRTIWPNLQSTLTSLSCAVRPSLGPRDGRFGFKVGPIGPKWDKSEAFSDQISVHLAPLRQMH